MSALAPSPALPADNRPTVATELDQLDAALQELVDEIHRLATKIDPVLRTPVPTPGVDPEIARPGTETQVGNAIRATTDTIRTAYRHVLDLRNRCAL